jgi:hypothetical protein
MANRRARSELARLRRELQQAAASAAATPAGFGRLTDVEWAELFSLLLENPEHPCYRDAGLAQAVVEYRAVIAAGVPELEPPNRLPSDHPVNVAFFHCVDAMKSCHIRHADELAESDPLRLARALVASVKLVGTFQLSRHNLLPDLHAFAAADAAGRADVRQARQFIDRCRRPVEDSVGGWITVGGMNEPAQCR